MTHLDEPSHPVTERLWRLAAAFHARLAADLASVGLTLAEFRLVGEVMRSADGLRQAELASRLSVSAPTVSAAVTRLERAGVLVRAADPSDPRARIVRLAQTAPLEPGLEVLDRIEAAAVAQLSASDRQALPRVLDRLAASLSAPDR